MSTGVACAQILATFVSHASDILSCTYGRFTCGHMVLKVVVLSSEVEKALAHQPIDMWARLSELIRSRD
jgi:hypothetical protein